MKGTRSFRTTSHVLGLVTLVGRLVQERLGYLLQSHGLSFAQAVALVRLWRSPDGTLRQSDLIESLTVSRALGSQLLGELERMKLIVRRIDSSDGRRQVVALTESGANLETEVLKVFDQVENELLTGTSIADLDRTRTILLEMLARSRAARKDRE